MVTAFTLRDGSVVVDRRLDRIPEYDEQSRGYQVRDLLKWGKAVGTVADRPRRKPAARRPAFPSLNQDPFGGCVLFSEATGFNASPARARPPIDYDTARDWYFDVQREDQYPGGEYPGATPRAGGTSLIAGARYLRRIGKLHSYWWCGAGSGTAIDDLVDALATPSLGGVQLGVRWLGSMFLPEIGGLLRVEEDSGEYGYHAIWSHTFRYARIPGHGFRKREHIVVQNTWGDWGIRWFGVSGHALVLVDDLEHKLLPMRFYGEAMVPIDVALAA